MPENRKSKENTLTTEPDYLGISANNAYFSDTFFNSTKTGSVLDIYCREFGIVGERTPIRFPPRLLAKMTGMSEKTLIDVILPTLEGVGFLCRAENDKSEYFLNTASPITKGVYSTYSALKEMVECMEKDGSLPEPITRKKTKLQKYEAPKATF